MKGKKTSSLSASLKETDEFGKTDAAYIIKKIENQ